MNTTTLIIAAVVVIGALAAYAGWLHYRLWRLRQRQQEAADSVVGAFDPAGQSSSGSGSPVGADKSIYLLAEAMLDDKMTHTEACIRICATASQLENFDQFRQEFGVLYRVVEDTAHIPILDDWQALEREEQRRYDKERRAVEAKYGDAIEDAARRLREQFG